VSWATDSPFSLNLFFFASWALFFFQPTLTPLHERLALYTMPLKGKRRVTLSPCWMNESHILTCMLSFALCSHKHYMFLVFLFFCLNTLKRGRFFQASFFGERGWTIPHEKRHFLLDMYFIANKIANLTSNSTWTKKSSASTEGCHFCWSWMDKLPALGVIESVAVLWTLYSIHTHIQKRLTIILVSFDSYASYLVACRVWRWVVHLGFEKQGNSSQKMTIGNRRGFIKSIFQSPPARFISHPAPFSTSRVQRSRLDGCTSWLEQVKKSPGDSSK
jgi:hypothetical protein